MPDLSALTHQAAIDLIHSLLDANGELQVQVMKLQQQVLALEQQVLELRSKQGGGGSGGAKSVPDWVKPNKQPRKPAQRKKRDQAFNRAKQQPTRVHVHAQEHCPDCGRKLSGGWVHRRREVIEIPELSVDIIHHLILARRCGVCGKRHLPSVDLCFAVLGKHRIGVRLMSLIGWLSTVGRMPVRRIQALLEAVCSLQLSIGEISQVLHTLAEEGKDAYQQLQEAVRSHGFTHADETGWREDGINGYLWSFSTPTTRFFLYDKSRSHEVPESVLGCDWKGILVSDFYSGYHYHLGLHQRCWVHFARDLHELKQTHSHDPEVIGWANNVLELYQKAKQFQSQRPRERIKAREAFQQEIAQLAAPYANRECAQRVLAQRIERFLPELFTFVEHPEVPADNNAAERAIRACVIARKVSGGTRSAKGSKTRSVLMSLFGTWQAQGRDALAACIQMLTQP
jgi:transposase